MVNTTHFADHPDQAPLVDLQALERTFDGKLQLLETLVQEFTAQSRQLLEQIKASLSGGDFSALTAQCHTLKGNAALMGAWQLEQASRRLEQASRSQDLGAASSLLEPLETALTQTLSCLDRFIHSRAP